MPDLTTFFIALPVFREYNYARLSSSALYSGYLKLSKFSSESNSTFLCHAMDGN